MASSRSGICFRISVSHVGSPVRTTNIRRKRNKTRIVPSAIKIADSREIFSFIFLIKLGTRYRTRGATMYVHCSIANVQLTGKKLFDPLSKFCIWRLCSFIQEYVKNFSHGNAHKPRRTVGGMRLKNKGFVPPLMLHMFFLCSFRDDYCYTVIAGGENGPSEFEFRRKNVFCGTKRRDFR